MQTYENKRVIQQGEDWNLNLLLSQSASEYIPGVLSKNLDNPHFVLTVASAKFDKKDKHVESWWQEITVPRFNQTTPYYVGEFSSKPTFEMLKAAASAIANDDAYERLYQYTMTNDNEFKYCYLTDKVNGTIEYDYELRICFNVLSHVPGIKDIGTSNWTSQEYLYQVTLVSGQLMIDTLIEAIDAYRTINWNSNMPKIDDEKYPTLLSYKDALEKYLESNQNRIDLFNKIKQNVPDFFQTDITWDSALGRIWSPVPIVKPTPIVVNSNLRKII